MTSGNRQSGFTLIELIVVVVLIGILMATGLRYYSDLVDEARRTSNEFLAAQFAGAVSAVHLKWVVDGMPAEVPVEDGVVLVNRFGWPVGEKILRDRGQMNACEQLWEALLYIPGAAGELPPELDSRRYRAAAPANGKCHYELQTKDKRRYFFDYSPTDGRVSYGNA